MKKTFNTDNITRFMGDHFIVFYEGDDVIDKVIQVHNAALKYYSDFKLWLEAGIYYIDGPISYSKAWDYAKLACDQLKSNGAGFYSVYTKELRDKIELRKYLQDHIDDAIAEGDLKVYYQPVVRAVSGRVCGFEALSRWIDPELGMISPGDFVPALEKRNLSYKLYKHVVDVVTDDLAKRVKNNDPIVCISINISRKDFDKIDTLEYMDNAIQQKGLEKWMLAAEITESAVMTNPQKVNEILNDFAEHGYEVWMDDFGSGYSSLNTLKNFRFDEIKLDMMFMRNFDDRSKKVLQSLIDMAKHLGIRTLAEGVETKEEYEFLRDAGCEKIQGFYFSKPRPANEIEEWLKEKNLKLSDREESRLFKELTPLTFNSETAFGFAIDYGIEHGFKTIYMSLPFEKGLRDNNFMTTAEANKLMNDATFPFARRFRKLAQMAEKSHKKESMEFAMGKHFYQAQMEQINSYSGYPFLLIEPLDITDQETEGSLNTSIISSLVNAFDVIYRYDFNNENMTVITSTNTQERTGQVFKWKEAEIISKIHPDDRLRLKNLLNPNTILQEVKKTGRGKYNQLFRLRQKDGSYQWTMAIIIMDSDEKNLSCLICLTPSAFAFDSEPRNLARMIFDDTAGISNEDLSPTALPENMITEEDASEMVTRVPMSVISGVLGKDLNTLDSFIKLFYSIGELNFESQTALIISGPSDIMGRLNDKPLSFQDAFDGLIEKHVQSAYQDKVRKFLDLKTLNARLTHGKLIMVDFVEAVYGWSRLRIIPSLRDEDGKVIKALFTIQNINEEKQHEAKIAYQANHDPLTHLLNRTGFIQVTNNLFDSSKKLGFALVDVDKFKVVNDTLGHEKGDKVLQLVASLLSKYISSDDILIRMGGDEFVIIRMNPDESGKDIKETVNKVNQDLKNSSLIGIPLSISAGVATSNEGYSQTLYQKADQAMYYVKHHGGAGCKIYDPSWTIN